MFTETITVEHTPTDEVLIARQIENMQKLADFLPTIPQEQFSMAKFYDEFQDDDAIDHQCGTVACAAGWAPFMPNYQIPSDYYSEIQTNSNGDQLLVFHGNLRDFIREELAPLNSVGIFDWAFGEEWTEYDDSPKGAAQRIQYMLRQGIPQFYVDGRSEPLCNVLNDAHDPDNPSDINKLSPELQSIIE